MGANHRELLWGHEADRGRFVSQSQLGHLRAIAIALCGVVTIGTGCVTDSVGPAYFNPEENIEEQAMARRELGIDYLATGRNAMALRELEFAHEILLDDPVTLLWLGEGYRRRNHMGKAVDFMQRAVEVAPDYHEARLNLSALYLQLERYEESIAQSQILIDDALYSQPWRAASNRGWAQFKLGRISEARGSFELALDFRRDYWPALLNLGILEESSGHQHNAIRNFERVLARGVRYQPGAETNFRLARLYVSMGDRQKAIRHFEAAVEEDPEGTWAEQSRDYLAMLQ